MVATIIVVFLIAAIVAVSIFTARQRKTVVTPIEDLPANQIKAARLRGLDLCECGAPRASKVHDSVARWTDYHLFVDVDPYAG